MYISARGASTCWDLPPSPAWRTACGIALCPSVWVSGVVWPSKNTANTTYVVFFFFNTIEKGIYFLFSPPDPITNHISFYDIFKKARDSVSSAWTLFSLCPLISARFLLQPSRWADPLVHPGASSLQTVPLATRCLPGDPGSEILQKAIVWSLHLWTQYLWPEVWSTLGASLVSSALPGQSSVSLIKKTAPWLALPPDP